MHASELVGKWAIRTKPISRNDDHSYCSGQPVFIHEVTEHHMFYNSTYGTNVSCQSGEWLENWVEWPPHIPHAGSKKIDPIPGGSHEFAKQLLDLKDAPLSICQAADDEGGTYEYQLSGQPWHEFYSDTVRFQIRTREYQHAAAGS